MRCDEMRASDTPVWIIGGGKTAMDTAHALITEYPGREVNLVAGSGTYFMNRDRFYFQPGPGDGGAARPSAVLALEVTRRFDGTNETDVENWFRDYLRHVVNPSRPATSWWACFPNRRTRRSPQA